MCDTFVALPPKTADGSILFGKNSNREPNEAQTCKAFQQAATVLPALTDRTRSTEDGSHTGWLYRNYWAKQNRAAKIPL